MSLIRAPPFCLMVLWARRLQTVVVSTSDSSQLAKGCSLFSFSLLSCRLAACVRNILNPSPILFFLCHLGSKYVLRNYSLDGKIHTILSSFFIIHQSILLYQQYIYLGRTRVLTIYLRRKYGKDRKDGCIRQRPCLTWFSHVPATVSLFRCVSSLLQWTEVQSTPSEAGLAAGSPFLLLWRAGLVIWLSFPQGAYLKGEKSPFLVQCRRLVCMSCLFCSANK